MNITNKALIRDNEYYSIPVFVWNVNENYFDDSLSSMRYCIDTKPVMHITKDKRNKYYIM